MWGNILNRFIRSRSAEERTLLIGWFESTEMGVINQFIQTFWRLCKSDSIWTWSPHVVVSYSIIGSDCLSIAPLLTKWAAPGGRWKHWADATRYSLPDKSAFKGNKDVFIVFTSVWQHQQKKPCRDGPLLVSLGGGFHILGAPVLSIRSKWDFNLK